MSEDASEPPTPDGPRASPATVLPFPSNRPLDRRDDRRDDGAGGEADRPGLRDVIGDVLRDERHRQERTLADVAREASVSLPYLSEVERGRKEVSSDLLDAIGAALELPLVEILERSAERLRTEANPTGRTIEMSVRSVDVRGQCTTRFQLAA